MRCQARSLPCVCGVLRGIAQITRNLDKEGRIQERFHKEAGFQIGWKHGEEFAWLQGTESDTARVRFTGRSEVERAKAGVRAGW